jgi:hypothetical protein
VSFPYRLEHLRRCTGSTRWWSVDCGILCRPRYPRSVHFSWSFPVNWYIQINPLYPAIKSVTFVSALASPLAQLHTALPQAAPYLPVAPSPPRQALPSFTAVHLTLFFFSVLLVDYPVIGTPLHTRRVLYTSHAPFFDNTVHFFFSPTVGSTVYPSLPFFTLLSTLP